LLSNSIISGKLRDQCTQARPTREALRNCCKEIAKNFPADCVLIAYSPGPELAPEIMAVEGKEELAEACLYRLGVEDRVALSKVPSKVYSDITGKPIFNKSGSLRIQKPSSGVLMARYVPKADFLLFGILDQDVKVYDKPLVAALEEVWSSWKDALSEAVGKVLATPKPLPVEDPPPPLTLPPLGPLEPLEPVTGIGKPLLKKSNVRDLNAPAAVPTTAGKTGKDRRRPTVLVDEVTRLFNRDYFEECIAIEVERAKRYSRNISLLYLGVTPHQAGMGKDEENAVATQVAEILALSLRKVDVICRLEPHKYGIILPDTADNTYGIIAKRVFKFFKQVMGETPSVFLNISASTYPKHAGNHLLLMQNAENLLVQAKEVGPNKAVLPE